MISLLLVASLAAAAPSDPSALDYALRFASAIVSDPKDMAKAQEAVVWDLAEAGRWDAARAAAGRIEGWRRGTAYADLAVALTKAGRSDEARALIGKAEAFRATVDGWQNPRIAAHVANAWTALGETAKAEQLASAIATEDAQQYAGRSAATIASGLAGKGRIDEAEKQLAALGNAKDIDDTWWRTVGYLEISRQASLTTEQRLAALEGARKSAAGIPTWKKAEALQSIADEYRKLGKASAAREIVSEAEAILVALPDTLPIKAPLLSNCARSWAELGRKEQARTLLAQVEGLAGRVQDIERPTVYANAARTAAAIGNGAEARRLYAKALEQAATLVNARPRALAVVEVCRSIERSGVPLDAATRRRLDTLYAGLKDPW